MAQRESGKKFTGWAAVVTLLAAAPLVAACSGGTSDTSDSSGDSSGSHKSSAPASSGTQAGGRSTVPSVVSAWVGAIIEKDAKQACLLSVMPGSGSSPKAATSQTCDASMVKKAAPGLKSMSKAFSPQNASGKPTVKVDAPTPAGDKAIVPTAKITVDGKPLRDILLSRSHGIDPKSFTAKVKTDKIDGKWYVGDFDINSGSGSNQTLQPQKQ